MIDIRQWGIRPKLTVLLLIPTLVALLLVGLRVQSALSSSASYARVERLAHAARTTTALVHGLQDERDLSAGPTAGRGQTPTATDQKRAAVDDAAAALRSELSRVSSSHTSALEEKITAGVEGLDRIPGLRNAATSTAAQRASVFGDYTTTIEQLLALEGEISKETQSTKLASRVFALESLSEAIESASRQRATLNGAFAAGTFRGTAYTDLVVARTQQEAAVADFLSHASAAQRQRFQADMRGSDVKRVQQIESAAIDGRATDSLGVNAQDLFALMSRQIDLLRKVESSQLDEILRELRQLSSEARKGLLGGVIIFLLLMVALAATMFVARSVLRPLQTLWSAALDIAYRRLPTPSDDSRTAREARICPPRARSVCSPTTRSVRWRGRLTRFTIRSSGLLESRR